MSQRDDDSKEGFEVSGFSVVLLANENRPTSTAATLAAIRELFDCELERLEVDPLPLGDRDAVLRALQSVEPIVAEGEAAFYEGDAVLKIVTPESGIIVVEEVRSPYFADPDAVTEVVADAKLAKVVEEHVGFLEIGLLGLDLVDRPIECGRRVCQLAAELCSDAIGAIAIPDRSLLACNRPEILDVLRSREPLDWPDFDAEPDARRMDPDDPEFDRRTQVARERWPEFVRAFDEDREGEMFSIKVGVLEGGVCENLWFWVRAIDGEVIHCELESEPIYLRGIARGDARRFGVGTVLDWVYTRADGETFGGFTVSPWSHGRRSPCHEGRSQSRASRGCDAWFRRPVEGVSSPAAASNWRPTVLEREPECLGGVRPATRYVQPDGWAVLLTIHRS